MNQELDAVHQPMSKNIRVAEKFHHPMLQLVALVEGLLGLASGLVLLSAHGVRGAGRGQRLIIFTISFIFL